MFIVVVGTGFPTDKYPGQGIFEYDQAKALAAYGHKVVYVAMDMRSVRRMRRFGIYHFPVGDVEVYCCSLPVGKPDSLVEKVGVGAFKKVMKRIIKRFGTPDIIHAHFGEIARYASAYRQGSDIKLVITEHSSNITEEISDSYKKKLTEIYAHADAILAVSSPLAANIKKHTGAFASVVHDMVDVSGFSKKTAASSKHGDKSQFVFLSAGNLVYRKGFDLLIKALAELKKRLPEANIRLLIMGGGEEYDNLVQLAESAGVSACVEFTGAYRREQFAKAMDDSDVFALASRGETFGVVYAEAITAGLPVIATVCGGPEDFITEKNGLLVPVEDVKALSDAMEKMYNGIHKYDRDAIRADAIERFSPECIAKQLTSVYGEILGR